MARTLKFAKGGRADRMRDRRMADIEKDFQKAIAKGKSEKEARAKRDQRIADAKDDYAKRTGADRTETRAAEKAAEDRLSRARRSPDKNMQPVSVVAEGSKPLDVFKDAREKVSTPKVAQAADDKPKASAKPKVAAKPKPKRGFDMDALRKLEAEVTRPKREPVRYGANFGKPERKPLPGSRLPAPSSPAPTLYGMAAVRERRRRAEEAKRPPASDTAQLLKKIRQQSGSSFAKGGKVDGAAVRGKTKAMRKK